MQYALSFLASQSPFIARDNLSPYSLCERTLERALFNEIKSVEPTSTASQDSATVQIVLELIAANKNIYYGAFLGQGSSQGKREQTIRRGIKQVLIDFQHFFRCFMHAYMENYIHRNNMSYFST